MNPDKPNRLHYPALDGLRGLCCLLVVFYHTFYFVLENYLSFIWVSIDIFFVLSGFLITDILLNIDLNKKSIFSFYVKRGLRVFPLYYLSLILFFIILPTLSRNILNIDYYIQNQAWFWSFLQNWLMIFNPPKESALVHLWSMAVEEQFYLLWPLVILLVKRPKRLLLIIISLLLAVIAFRFWIWDIKIEKIEHGNLYSFTRIDGICVGCIIAIMKKIKPGYINKRIAIIILAIAGLNFLFYYFNRESSMPYFGLIGFFTFSIVVGILVDEIINNENSIFSKIFRVSPLRFIGRISYGTYIFHLPVYLAFKPYVESWTSTHIESVPASYFASAVLTILSFLIGYISYKYFEIHFLRLKQKI